MAVPQRRQSKSRKNMRKSQWIRLQPAAQSKCSNCDSVIRPHRMCPQCGYYKGREVKSV